MARRTWIVAGLLATPVALAVAILLADGWPFKANAAVSPPQNSPPTAAAPLAPAKQAAQQLAQQWAFSPQPAPPNHSSSSGAAGRRAFLDQYLRDNGKAKAWFDRAVTFYVEKCGSEFNPITSKQRIIGHNGTNKSGGQYLITEPGLLNLPVNQIPPQPNEVLFAYDDQRSSVTILVRQQGADVVTIMVIAAVR